MALNQMYNDGVQFDVLAADVDAPVDPASGDAVRVGELPAVALTGVFESHDGDERITIKTNGVYELPVEAADGAVGVGDVVYVHNSNGSLDNNEEGVGGRTRFGYALAPVDSSATSVIPVKIGY